MRVLLALDADGINQGLINAPCLKIIERLWQGDSQPLRECGSVQILAIIIIANDLIPAHGIEKGFPLRGGEKHQWDKVAKLDNFLEPRIFPAQVRFELLLDLRMVVGNGLLGVIRVRRARKPQARGGEPGGVPAGEPQGGGEFE